LATSTGSIPRQIDGDLVHGPLNVSTEAQDVSSVAQGDGQADGRLSVNAEDRLRRIDVSPPDIGNVAQSKQAAVRSDVDRQNIEFGFERTGNAKRNPFITRLQGPGRTDCVLPLQRSDQSRAVDPQTRKLFGRKLDDDLLVLGAEDRDLGDVGDPQQSRADFFDIIAKLAVRKAIGGEAVDDSEGVAELVVETRPYDTGRQSMADVADVLSDVIPDVRYLVGRRAAFQGHENGGGAGAGKAPQEIEMRGLLERLLDPFGYLIERVIEGCAWPGGLHDHGPESKCRIFVAPETQIGPHARDDRDEHQKHHERAVL
jgi:hypothetical protein